MSPDNLDAPFQALCEIYALTSDAISGDRSVGSLIDANGYEGFSRMVVDLVREAMETWKIQVNDL